MPPVDYNKQCNEWTSIGLYRTALKNTPTLKLNKWASDNNFDYARLVLKNAEARKIDTIDEQIKYCTDKVSQIKIKMGKTDSVKVVPDTPPAPVAEINTDVKKWKDKYDACYTELLNMRQAELHRQLADAQMELFKPAGIPLPDSESDSESDSEEEEGDNLINLVIGSDVDTEDEEDDDEEDDDEDYDDY